MMEIEALTLFNEQSDLALYAMYASLTIGMFIVAFLGILNRFTFSRSIITVLFVCCLGIGYVSLGELLSRPKPVDIMTWDRPDVEKARVLAFHLVEGKAIYMLLLYEGVEVPRYYQYPWNKNMGEMLQRGKRAMELGEIQGMELLDPFQQTWEERKHPEIHELPWPKPPGKHDPNENEVIDLDKMV